MKQFVLMDILQGVTDSVKDAAHGLNDKITDLTTPITKEEIIYARQIIKKMHPLRSIKVKEVLSWWDSFLKVINSISNAASSAAKTTVEETAKLTDNDALKTGISNQIQVLKSDDIV